MLSQYLDTSTVLMVATSVLIPLLSSLLSRAHWPSEVTGLLTLLIAAASGFLTDWYAAPNATHYDWKTAAVLAGVAYLTAVLARIQLWAGTKTDAKLLAVGSKQAAVAPPTPAVTDRAGA